MTTIINVADDIVNKIGVTPTMKLQKLCFYSYVNHLVTYDSDLFHERFQAWFVGPVSIDLFMCHRKKFLIRPGELNDYINPTMPLNAQQKESINGVCQKLGQKTGNQLCQLVHTQQPWIDARGDKPFKRDIRTTIIHRDSIKEFYSHHSYDTKMQCWQ